jgi:two-component system phosphate regulon sensor histidine kinase PhoR
MANPAAEVLIGRDPTGETLMGVMPNPELEALIDDARRVSSEGMERRVEFDKRIYHARAVTSNSAENPFAVLTLRDVTQIQRLERARREMVANVTHELSTPITAIGLLAETLFNVAQTEKPKKLRKLAKDIRVESETLTHLVEEMRDLSLIESGQMPVRLMPTDLLGIVQATTEQLQPLAEGKNHNISLDIAPGILVLADERQIQRAIKNILHNAIKFTPAGGHIQLRATTNENEVILAVTDNGPGIPSDDLPRVFERFFQVDRARHDGTGLGLAIVRHIVLAHGGRVWAESVQGQGATFYITLALAEKETTPPEPSTDQQA